MSTGDLNVSLENSQTKCLSLKYLKKLRIYQTASIMYWQKNLKTSAKARQTTQRKPHETTKQEDDFLAEIAGGFTHYTDVGPVINSKLADIVNSLVSKKWAGGKVRDLLEKYPWPKNCNSQVRRINPEIWETLPGPSKTRDIRMQKAKKFLEKQLCHWPVRQTNLVSKVQQHSRKN